MKFYLTVPIIALLVGCASKPVPVERKFPEPPKILLERCQNLIQMTPEKNSITDMLTVVIENYSLYHQCSNRVEGWNTWYEEQKKIFEKK
jgi:hypothetical protein